MQTCANKNWMHRSLGWGEALDCSVCHYLGYRYSYKSQIKLSVWGETILQHSPKFSSWFLWAVVSSCHLHVMFHFSAQSGKLSVILLCKKVRSKHISTIQSSIKGGGDDRQIPVTFEGGTIRFVDELRMAPKFLGWATVVMELSFTVVCRQRVREGN